MRLPKKFTAVSIAGLMVATAFAGALPAAANGCGFSTRAPSAGTEAVPFQVIDEADLRCLAANAEYWDNYFVQTNNIPMLIDTWTPIGTSSNRFAGGFDGGGFSISGLTITSIGPHVAMFAYASRATFANINLESVNISGSSHVAGLVALVNDGTGTVSPTLRATTITNVSVSGVLQSSGVIGGLVAEMTSNLTDDDGNDVTMIVRSSGSARIETSSRVAGGIVGKASRIVIANSTSTNQIADQSVMPTSVDLCDPNQFRKLDTNSDGFFDRTEDPSTQGIGGIVGYGERMGINDSTSETIITSSSNRLGGIAGNLLSSDIENSTATGFVNSRTAVCVGGLVGIMENTTVSDSHWRSQGPVIGLAIVGGLVGLAGWGAQVYDSGASGDQVTAVSGAGSGPVGGAIGIIHAPYQQYPTHITGSWSTVPVQGAFAAGGLVGYVFSGSSFGERVPEHAVFQSWSSSSVRLSGSTDTTPMAGGLVGFLFGGMAGSGSPNPANPVAPGVYPSVVSQSYAVGNVTGEGLVGGLVGYMAGMIWDSYATGEIRGASTDSAAEAGAGGLVGNTIDAVFTSISRTYALGPASVGNPGDPAIGGLVGSWGTDPNASTIAPNSFSLAGTLRPLGVNTQSERTDPEENGSLAVARTSEQLREIATYASWAYQQFPNGPINSITSQWLDEGQRGDYIWGICTYANNGYPFLQWQYTSDPCVAPDNGGGGGAVEIEQATPVITPVAAPAVIVESVVLKPVPLNPVKPEVLSPGVVLVSEAVAALTPERVMRNPPASSLGEAPRVQARIGVPLALVTSGLPANSTQSVRLKINGKYVDLGVITTDADGQAALPVFRIGRAGTYTIAMINSVTGKASYVKVVVPKRQRR